MPIKVLTDDPVTQPPKLLSIVVQFVAVLKQQLRKLRRDFKEGMLVSQRHKRPRATAILKWGPSFPRRTDGVKLCRFQGQNLLQVNLMLPAISEVIFVNPAFFAAEVEDTESHLMRIVAEAYSAGLPYPIRLAPNEELVQMFIGPAEGNLECVTELSNGAVAAHQEATPDLGTDFSYPDTQLIDLHRLVCTTHALPLLP